MRKLRRTAAADRSDDKWSALSEPLLAFLRSLPEGAAWPALKAWRKELVFRDGRRTARLTVGELGNCLAWLENNRLAHSTGGREAYVVRVIKGTPRKVRRSADEVAPVRWVAGPRPASRASVARAESARKASLPVRTGERAPAVLPPLRGPFLSEQRASGRVAGSGSGEDGDHPTSMSGDHDADGPRRDPADERALREEACAPRMPSAKLLTIFSPTAVGLGACPTGFVGPVLTKEARRRYKNERDRDYRAKLKARSSTLPACRSPGTTSTS